MAAEEPAKPKRRIVKKVETIREQAEKTANTSKKPKKDGVLRLVFRYIAVPFRFTGRGLAKVGRLKPFRFIGRILVPAYFRNSWKELRQVTWPTRKETLQLTFAVIVFSIIFGGIIAIVDYGLDKVFREVLLK
ncbi:MAG TPA: preprotein translocase subunit SecE [Candidatus Saccharimonadales bacterium]|nr:preprotein translocase subunit SecE [Candidatus Saccharimonadales bacterium]